MKPLTAVEVRALMKEVQGWRRRGLRIHRWFEFQDFPAAMRFVSSVARLAERAQHHPDIDIRWNRVRLELTTHDAGGLTALDFSLAAGCDRVAAKAGGGA